MGRGFCIRWVHGLQVFGSFYSRVQPTPTGERATLVAFSPEAAALIGLAPGEAQRQEFVDAMAGAARLPGSDGWVPPRVW